MSNPALVAAAAATSTSRASLTGGVSLPVLGVLCAAAAAMLMWKRRDWRRTQALLLLVTGLSLAGAAGHVRDALTRWATSASTSGTSKVFGVGVPYAIALVVVLWFVLDMDLDGLLHKARKRGTGKGGNRHTTSLATPLLALLVVPAIAVLPVVGVLPSALVEALG